MKAEEIFSSYAVYSVAGDTGKFAAVGDEQIYKQKRISILIGQP